jgi:hypothetical protein
MSTQSRVDQVMRAADQASDSKQIGWLARLGLAARATVYLVIGILALLAAQGARGQDVDQQGALEELVSHSYGKALVGLLAVGFLGYAIWRLAEAATGVTGEPDGTGPRVKSAVRGAIYLVLTFTAVSVLVGAGQSQSEKQSSLTAEALQWPGGRVLVALVGLVIAGAGIAMVVEGWTLKFMRFFRAVPANIRRTVVHLGRVGTIGRGAVFSVVGLLVVSAAWTLDPDKAGGLDTAFRTLLSQPYGKVLGIVMALALIAFGVYGYAEARWRKV